MNMTVNAKKMQVSQAFTDYAQKRLTKLDKFFDSDADAKMMLS